MTESHELAARQIRAARNWLKWSRAKLAKESMVSSFTIKNLELFSASGINRVKFPKDETYIKIVMAFGRAGISFTSNGGVAPIQREVGD